MGNLKILVVLIGFLLVACDSRQRPVGCVRYDEKELDIVSLSTALIEAYPKDHELESFRRNLTKRQVELGELWLGIESRNTEVSILRFSDGVVQVCVYDESSGSVPGIAKSAFQAVLTVLDDRNIDHDKK